MPDITVSPNEYVAIYNTGYQGFSLVNGSGMVSLTYGKEVVYKTNYASTKEGYSWSLIGDYFVFSIPAPNLENMLDNLVIADKSGNLTELKPCASDQERNPTTNRCRNIKRTSPTKVTDGVKALKASESTTMWVCLG